MITSRTQVDKLGDRLRSGNPTEADLRELDEYRRSFGPAYEEVVRRIRNELNLEPSGRPRKTTSSIIEKLRRESSRIETDEQNLEGIDLVDSLLLLLTVLGGIIKKR